MRLQLPDVADAMPRLSRSEEIAIWREMRTREPPEDPFRRWAELQLAKAGLASGSTHPDIWTWNPTPGLRWPVGGPPVSSQGVVAFH
jgi:hypothetical protein